MSPNNLTEETKTRARELGADLVGIAPVERFASAPRRMSPQGLLPGARCVVVCAIHHLDAAVELSGEPTPHQVGAYGSQSWGQNAMLDDISFQLARFLEEKGHRALAIAASNIWRYHGYKELAVPFAPDLAHRYAAVAAGLGEIGWSGLVLTPHFGPRVRFVSVITDADLEPSPMYEGPPLCDRCGECVRHCPTDAFRKEVRGENRVEIGGKVCVFPNINKWRCAWAENFALNLALPIPDKVDEAVIRTQIEKYGMFQGEEGSCLKFCMPPSLRVRDPAYARAPRRRKGPDGRSAADLMAAVRRLSARYPVDVLAVTPREAFAGDPAFHPEYHLPDAASIILLGTHDPMAGSTSETSGALARLLRYAAFDVARLFDLAGYSALVPAYAYHHLVAQRLGVLERGLQCLTVLTSAALPTLRLSAEPGQFASSAEDIRRLARSYGADLVGFYDVQRFAAFRRALAAAVPLPAEREVVRDRGGLYLPFIPEIAHERLRFQGPEDWLPGAKTVIVLGLRLPDTSFDTAKVTPAETVGPFAFAMYESLLLLGDCAARLVKALQHSGYRAVLATDMEGLASWTVSPRGRLPDLRANRFSALLAGLGQLGLHGYVLTPQYGVRQRFMTVVTDCPLPPDPLPTTPAVCRWCEQPCRRACPTQAITSEVVEIAVEGARFCIPRVQDLACDWAKLYALSGEEGPRYLGLAVDVPIPSAPDARAVAEAVAEAEWGVQKRLLAVAEECVRVCPAHRLG